MIRTNVINILPFFQKKKNVINICEYISENVEIYRIIIYSRSPNRKKVIYAIFLSLKISINILIEYLSSEWQLRNYHFSIKL